MKRIFAAIDISPKAKTEVLNYTANLKKQFSDIKVGWATAEKLHLTLKFLGDTEEVQIDRVKNITEDISRKYRCFNANIKETGVFPSPKQKPRILWLGIEDETKILESIKDKLDFELEKIGFEKEKRKFNPHLTIGRLREPHKSKDLVKKHLLNKFEPVRFEVSEIVIYESELKPKGSIYSVISKHKFV